MTEWMTADAVAKSGLWLYRLQHHRVRALLPPDTRARMTHD